MAELSMEKARFLAGMLKTAGHPYDDAAILGTACDLVEWCKGAIIEGRVVTPEQQAQALVHEVRTQWDGWPEKGGTHQLLELFRSKYSNVTVKAPVLSLSDAVSRGLLAKPCALCAPDALHCEYGGIRGHEMEGASVEALSKQPSRIRAVSVNPQLALDQILAQAEATYQDEQRRKAAQIEGTGG